MPDAPANLRRPASSVARIPIGYAGSLRPWTTRFSPHQAHRAFRQRLYRLLGRVSRIAKRPAGTPADARRPAGETGDGARPAPDGHVAAPAQPRDRGGGWSDRGRGVRHARAPAGAATLAADRRSAPEGPPQECRREQVVPRRRPSPEVEKRPFGGKPPNGFARLRASRRIRLRGYDAISSPARARGCS